MNKEKIVQRIIDMLEYRNHTNIKKKIVGSYIIVQGDTNKIGRRVTVLIDFLDTYIGKSVSSSIYTLNQEAIKYNKSIHKDFSLEVFIQNIEKKYNSCFDFSHINDNLETESLDKIRKRFLNYDYIFNNSELDYLPCLLSHSIIE